MFGKLPHRRYALQETEQDDQTKSKQSALMFENWDFCDFAVK